MAEIALILLGNPVLRIYFLIFLLHAYVGWRLLPDLSLGEAGFIAMAAWLALSSALLPLGLFARRIARQPASDLLAWAGLMAMGSFSSLLVLTIVRDAGLLVAFAFGWFQFQAWSAAAVPLLAALLTLVGPLSRLRARHGACFVTGNHEYYSGANGWIAELRRLGLRVLLNEHVVLEHKGESIVVAGVTDYGAHHYDIAHKSDPAAMKGAPERAAFRVLLAHQPRHRLLGTAQADRCALRDHPAQAGVYERATRTTPTMIIPMPAMRIGVTASPSSHHASSALSAKPSDTMG